MSKHQSLTNLNYSYIPQLNLIKNKFLGLHLSSSNILVSALII